MVKKIREIYTKALLAKGENRMLKNYEVKLNHPHHAILGCWITNHTMHALLDKDQGTIDGSFDMHLWYSYDEIKSEVIVIYCNYKMGVDLVWIDLQKTSQTEEILSVCLDEPKCKDVKIRSEDQIEVSVEWENELRVLGQTSIKIELQDDLDDIDTEFIK